MEMWKHGNSRPRGGSAVAPGVCLLLRVLSRVVALVVGAMFTVPVGAAPEAGPTGEEVARITAAAPERATVRPARPRRLLVFSGNLGFDHTAIPYGARAAEILGKKTGAFEVTHSTDTAVFTPDSLKQFDALFLNNGYDFVLDAPAQQALVNFVRGGKGLVGIHAASANFKGWPEGTELLGARFKNHPWTPKAEWAIRNDDPTHPLNAAFAGKGFRLREEMYAFTEFRPERERVLLSLDLWDPLTAGEPHSETAVPVSWVHRCGKGRVFFCSLGHVHDLFWNPAYLRHLLDGIQFALGDLKADITPNPGPAQVSDEALDASTKSLLAHEAGGSLLPLRALNRAIADASRDVRRRAEIEARLLLALRAAGTEEGKRVLAELLSRVAGRASVPALSLLLLDDRTEHLARVVLQRVTAPEARAALRTALAKAPAQARIGILASLGEMRDRQAVPAIAGLAADPDAGVPGAALRALASIGSPEAGKALLQARVSPAMQPALEDAQTRCADRLAGEGHAAAAQSLYLALAGETRSPRARGMGLAGQAATRHPDAADRVLAALESEDPHLRRRALQVAPRIRGDAVTRRVLALYASLPAPEQMVLLTALAEGGSLSALPVALKGLSAEDAGLRAAAIHAVGALGGRDAVLPLARAASQGERGEKQLALECLVRLRGKGVEGALLGAARRGAPHERAVVLGVLAERGTATAVPLLLDAMRERDAGVAAAALKSLGRLAGAREVGALVRVLLATEDEAVGEAARDALVTMARRVGDPDGTLRPLFEALPGAPVERKPVLIEALAGVGGDRALAEITKATGSPEAEVKRAAILALAESWEDTRPLPTLLGVATSDSDRVLKVQALRGTLRLLALDATAQPRETVARVAEAMALAARPEEKRQALGVLRACRVPEAVSLAARCLDDPALHGDAAETLFALATAQAREGERLPGVKGSEIQAALERVRDGAKAPELRERARAILEANLPDPWESQDVGAVRPSGSTRHAGGVFTIDAAGADIWGQADAFHFVSRPMEGDGTITARVVSLKNTNPWAKAGVMLRESLRPGSRYAFMGISPTSGDTFQRRAVEGGESQYCAAGGVAAPCWVKLTRAGDRFTGYVSADGKTWRKSGEAMVEMAKSLLVGLAVTSHHDGTLTRAVTDDVAMTTP